MALLGPAFVAAVAYVDPGNVAANLTAGARYGYLLVWVLVLANLMAMLIQYQSAKLGLATGKSLPELLGERLGTWPRRFYWLQAELIAAVTDVAEVVGGAIALHLLVGLPLVVGGTLVGTASLLLLLLQHRRSQQRFELAVVMLLAVVAAGFLAGLLFNPPPIGSALGGLLPRFSGADSVLLAASMLGATVMPHVIYLHSSLARDRHLQPGTTIADHPNPARLLRATRVDVVLALLLAGAVNIGMLLLAASNFQGAAGTDSIEGAHRVIVATLGSGVGVAFAVGLLAASLASTSVGAYAGDAIMRGLLRVRVPIWLRRVVTLIPALLLLAGGVDPTTALVFSQVVLSVGIPFAIIPLVRLCSDRSVMGQLVDATPARVVAWLSVALVVALNVTLILLTLR